MELTLSHMYIDNSVIDGIRKFTKKNKKNEKNLVKMTLLLSLDCFDALLKIGSAANTITIAHIYLIFSYLLSVTTTIVISRHS